MRKVFSNLLEKEMSKNNDLFLLTADLGYNLWDGILGFQNTLVLESSEQFMVGAAAGLALEGKVPICYSITPFLLYRPFEFIRNFMQYEQLPIKLLGGGRGRDYESLGYTHWAEEDQNIISVLDNIESFLPESREDVEDMFSEFLYNGKPSYMNLRR